MVLLPSFSIFAYCIRRFEAPNISLAPFDSSSFFCLLTITGP